MIDCAAMQDRMPDAAHGRTSWTAAEAAHLTACADCALEWRIVQAGAMLHARTPVATDRIGTLVATRLRDLPVAAAPVRRLPWRGSLIGLVAAAASVVLLLGIPRHGRETGDGAIDSMASVAVLPELQGLSDNELESALGSLGSAAADAPTGDVTHLEDLTDAELEQLLHSMGGQ